MATTEGSNASRVERDHLEDIPLLDILGHDLALQAHVHSQHARQRVCQVALTRTLGIRFGQRNATIQAGTCCHMQTRRFDGTFLRTCSGVFCQDSANLGHLTQTLMQETPRRRSSLHLWAQEGYMYQTLVGAVGYNGASPTK